MATLNDVLYLLAAQLHLEGSELIQYAAEDTLGGYHSNAALARWHVGSIWGSEGQILYALTRALKPELIVEVGGYLGCSASHFAAACKANGKGSVVSVDSGRAGAAHGKDIPAGLRSYVQLVTSTGEEWLAKQDDNSIGLLFEDAMHDVEGVAAISRLAMDKLEPGGLLINHDASHPAVGGAIREGLRIAAVDFRVFCTEESDCGVAISKKNAGVTVNIAGMPLTFPVDRVIETDASPLVKDQMDSEPEPKKRTRRKRNAAGKLV